jgi:hypothetical protein
MTVILGQKHSDEPCGTDELIQQLIQQYPQYSKAMATHIRDWENFQRQGQNFFTPPPYIIPVVVHVLYEDEDGEENISDIQISDAIQDLNSFYSGKDINQIGGISTTNTLIEFQLAQIDPFCNITKGITRNQDITYSNLTGVNLATDELLKTKYGWPADKYLNLYVVKKIGLGTYGYSHIPLDFSVSDIPTTSGAVIRYDYFGTTEMAAPNKQSRTLPHEVGHSLGLLHTFFSNSSPLILDCHTDAECMKNGDLVCDTPPVINGPASVFQPCDDNLNTCTLDSQDDDVHNYMGYYTDGCQFRFSEGQKDRIYYILDKPLKNLCSEENLICTGVHPNSTIPYDIVISTPTDWNPDTQAAGVSAKSVTVKAGVVLNISSVPVRFCQGGTLTIEPGAKVYLNAATLTASTCAGVWNGVVIQQAGGKQGLLSTAKNSVIERAMVGVSIDVPLFSTQLRGGIACQSTTFRNNGVGVQLTNNTTASGIYKNERTSFVDCNFVNDANYSPLLSGFQAFIQITNCSGLRITNTQFDNSQSYAGGKGIVANNAGYSVSGVCTSEQSAGCNGQSNTTFRNLYYGIENTSSNSARGIYVNRCNFEDCTIGVFNQAISTATIIRNVFRMGKLGIASPPSIAGYEITKGNSPQQIGLVYDGITSTMKFQENTFTRTRSQEGSTLLIAGSICKNLGSYDNIARKNNYKTMNVGSAANGLNRSDNIQPNLQGVSGLQYQCNIHTNSNSKDIRAFDEGIRKNQGEPMKASGNQFSPLITTNIQFNSTLTSYNSTFFHWDTPIEIPKPVGNFLAQNLGNQIAQYKNQCLSEIDGPVYVNPDDLVGYRTALPQATATYQALYSKLENATDEKEKETLTLELEKVSQERQHYFEALQAAYLSNEDSTDIEAIREVYEAYQSYGTDIILLNDYWKEQNDKKAQEVLNRLTKNDQLSEAQVAEVKQLQQLHEIKLLAQKEERALNEKEQAVLFEYIKEGETPISYIFEQALLPYNYAFPRSYQILGEDEEVNPGRIAAPTPNIASNNTLTIAPNPSSDETTITWSVVSKKENTSAILTLQDLNGRVLWQQPIDANIGQSKINTQQLSNGIYYCTLVAEGEKLVTQKLIIIK